MWILAMLGGCDVLHEVLFPPRVVHFNIQTSRTFRDNDPRKSDITITGHDEAGCERSFAFHSQAPGPSPMHTVACSDLLYLPGAGSHDGLCTFYCEITGPL